MNEPSEKKLKVGVVGATGTVGRCFLRLLRGHPFFEVGALAASASSAGRSLAEALTSRGVNESSELYPRGASEEVLLDAADVRGISERCDLVFCAVNADRARVRELETAYAQAELPVISNNSAHRGVPDVPMIIPELNPEHLEVIGAQRARLGTSRGFIAVKPNCSVQSYLPLLAPLRGFGLSRVAVTTLQAASGAGRRLEDFPELADNVIPFIGGEEEKSAAEPLKLLGHVKGGEIVPANGPKISVTCTRVPVSHGHIATVAVSFERKPEREEMIEAWRSFRGLPQELRLPSAPERFITYFEEPDRPQPRLDRDLFGGMGISVGRLRGSDGVFDYRFVGLSHNLVRGAAGGALLTAELLCALGYLN